MGEQRARLYLGKCQSRQRSEALPAGSPWTTDAEVDALTAYFEPPAHVGPPAAGPTGQRRSRIQRNRGNPAAASANAHMKGSRPRPTKAKTE